MDDGPNIRVLHLVSGQISNLVSSLVGYPVSGLASGGYFMDGTVSELSYMADWCIRPSSRLHKCTLLYRSEECVEWIYETSGTVVQEFDLVCSRDFFRFSVLHNEPQISIQLHHESSIIKLAWILSSFLLYKTFEVSYGL